jgi:hypothetical protein
VSPAPIYCEEKNRLLDEYVAALGNYLKVESAKIATGLRGDDLLFDPEFAAARNRKDAAKETIKSHLQEHGC